MPLGIVSDSEFEKERSNSEVNHIPSNDENQDNSSPIITSDVITLDSPGRYSEVPNVPQSLRKLLGEEAATNGLKSAMQFANSLTEGRGVTQPTLSRYANGIISPGSKDSDLLNHINNRKTKISKRALGKLNLALSLLDEQKLLGCDAPELASVAKSMADVANKMEPSKSEDDSDKKAVQFHFYAPQLKNETHYEVIPAKDNY